MIMQSEGELSKKVDANDVLRERGSVALRSELEDDTLSAQAGSDGFAEFTLLANSEPPPIFPTNCLPTWLRAYVEAVFANVQTPPDLAGANGLGVMAASTAGRFQVRVKSGHFEPTNLFLATAMPPASRKSAVFSTMMRPILEWEGEEAKRLGPAIREATLAHELADNRLKARKLESKKAIDGQDAEKILKEVHRLAEEVENLAKTIPAIPRKFTDNCTEESLTKLLSDHAGVMAVLSAEGKVFDQMSGEYGDVAKFDVYKKGHAGDTIRVDRIGRESNFIRKPALTVCVCTQPEVLSGLGKRKGFRVEGLLGRILYVMPESNVGNRTWQSESIPLEVEAEYARRIKQILSLPWNINADGYECAWTLILSSEARDLIELFFDEIECQLGEGNALHSIQDWAGKLVGAVARIAANLHIAEVEVEPQHTQISRETMANAIELGWYFLAHAKHVFNMMQADLVVELAKRIASWIKRKHRKEKNGCERFNHRDLCNGIGGEHGTKETLKAPLDLLIERGYIREAQSHELQKKQGRQKSQPYEVNPEFLTHVTTQ